MAGEFSPYERQEVDALPVDTFGLTVPSLGSIDPRGEEYRVAIEDRLRNIEARLSLIETYLDLMDFDAVPLGLEPSNVDAMRQASKDGDL